MRRKCNLELRLVPPAPYFDSMGNKESIDEEKEQQKLTIFYDGKVVVSDATEVQAKAIIHLANREMKGNTKILSSLSEPPSPLLQSQTEVSMKKSLQRFLQKRKSRTQAISPYHQQQ
ncbi:protein TIFY 5A-like [Solanum verrucosum]|uniref:protein TIFY 5A-like n=1 Tax=Solanum verrucosum TaxID=315347 RepID=UPI0020D15FBB|nr:protein TIFY 5A-like [Solanum verrucosum]